MFVSLMLLSLALGAEPAAYPKSELLIEPAALAERLDKFVILDTRLAKVYEEAHVPGALRVDAGEWSKLFNAKPDAATWAKTLGDLGIATDTPVAVYGGSWTDSARVWWLLKQYGVKDARLMNGSFAVWKEAGLKVAGGIEKPKPIDGKVEASNRLATKDDVKKTVESKSAQILDVRTENEFCGVDGTAKKKGAIPGATHLEWKEFINAKTQKLKPSGEIAALLEKAGIDPKKPVVTYCQSGGRASVGAFVLELMGGEQVKNYYRSWSEWGNADDTPVETPKKK